MADTPDRKGHEMEHYQRVHMMAAWRHIEAGRASGGEFDEAVDAFTIAASATDLAVGIKMNYLALAAMRMAESSPAGGDGRHDNEAADACYRAAFAHMLAAFPDQGPDPAESGWAVEVERDDTRHVGMIRPSKQQLEGILASFGANLDEYDEETGYLVTLPSDCAQYLRRTGELWLQIPWDGQIWSVYAEMP